METNNEIGQKLSPEELEKRKKEMLTFYKDSMPYLEAQLEYETKLMEVDEVRFKRFQISMQSAMMMQDQRQPTEEELKEMAKEDESNEPTAHTAEAQPKKKKALRTQ